jgi:DNA-binding MurR/RpiR family transcriptional regulator
MSNIPSEVEGHIEDSDDPHTVVQKVTLKSKQVLQDTADFIVAETLNRAVDTMLRAKKILIFGVGSSGITALDAQYRFMRLGLNVEAQRDPHIFAMLAALVDREDVVFGISTSGSTKDVIEPMAIAKKNGAAVICVTSHAKSPITNYADIVLPVPSRESPLQGGALSTKIGQIHIIDLLSQLIIIKNKAYSLESIQKTSNSVADKLY